MDFFCVRRLNMGAEQLKKKMSRCKKMRGEERGGGFKL